MVHVSAAHEVTDELLRAVRDLLPQLSSSAHPPTPLELDQILGSPATTLLVARHDASSQPRGEAGRPDAAGPEGPYGPIVGMLTLVTFRLPTGVRARIEDVVVDGAMRGRGVASALTAAALELAAASGAHTVDLTSRPSREAANRLYQHLGFEQRETVVYRFRLPPQ